MTENEIKFLLTHWGTDFAKDTLTEVSTITKTPQDSIVLAIAVKQLIKQVNALKLLIPATTNQQPPSAFDIPTADPTAPGTKPS